MKLYFMRVMKLHFDSFCDGGSNNFFQQSFFFNDDLSSERSDWPTQVYRQRQILGCQLQGGKD